MTSVTQDIMTGVTVFSIFWRESYAMERDWCYGRTD
jgi:hypothetical protein